MQKRLREQRGFTLIEMMVVLAIIALIAVFAVPSIQRALQNSRIKTVEAQARLIQNAFDQYYNDHIAYPAMVDDTKPESTEYEDLFGAAGALSDYVSLPETEEESMFMVETYEVEDAGEANESYELVILVRNLETDANQITITPTAVTRAAS